jgi:hypothetical protein
LGEQMTVDAPIIVRVLGALRERTARHEDNTPARSLNKRALLFVSGKDLIESSHAGGKLIGIRAAENGTAPGACFGAGRAYQIFGRAPIQAHPALRRIHHFGDSETERPQIAAIRKGRGHIDSGLCIVIGDDMRGGIRYSAFETGSGPGRKRLFGG